MAHAPGLVQVAGQALEQALKQALEQALASEMLALAAVPVLMLGPALASDTQIASAHACQCCFVA
jgi:hypothetical protein